MKAKGESSYEKMRVQDDGIAKMTDPFQGLSGACSKIAGPVGDGDDGVALAAMMKRQDDGWSLVTREILCAANCEAEPARHAVHTEIACV